MENYKKIKARGIRLLSRREYSVTNLQKKLTDYARIFSPAVSSETVKLVINELINKNWVSDERAVESLINQKISSCGTIKLRIELNKLDVDKELVEKSLNKIAPTEYQRAYKLLVKKYKNAPVDLKQALSQKNFLVRRGFNFDICKKVVDGRLQTI